MFTAFRGITTASIAELSTLPWSTAYLRPAMKKAPFPLLHATFAGPMQGSSHGHAGLPIWHRLKISMKNLQKTNTSDGLQPTSDGLQPNSNGGIEMQKLLWNSAALETPLLFHPAWPLSLPHPGVRGPCANHLAYLLLSVYPSCEKQVLPFTGPRMEPAQTWTCNALHSN